jgi:hypothetical protein
MTAETNRLAHSREFGAGDVKAVSRNELVDRKGVCEGDRLACVACLGVLLVIKNEGKIQRKQPTLTV